MNQLMGSFGRNVYNGRNGQNVPVYAISSGPAYIYRESTSPWTWWRMLAFVNYLGKKRSI